MQKINKALLYVSIILACVGIFFFRELSALIFFLSILGLIVLIIARSGSIRDKKFLIAMILVIFLSRFFLSFVVMKARGMELSQDEGLYSKKALMESYKMEGLKGIEPMFMEYFNDIDMIGGQYGKSVYTTVLSYFYHFFGYQIQAVRSINAILAIGVFLLLYSIANSFFGQGAARLSAVVFALFPSLALWSVMISIDMTVILCILVYVYALINIAKLKVWALLIMAGSIIIINSIRGHVSEALILASVILFSIGALKEYFKTRKRSALTFIIVVAILAIAAVGFAGAGRIISEKISMAIQRQGGFATADDGGYVVYPLHCYYKGQVNFSDILFGYINGIRYALFAPFPWRVDSKLQLMAYVQMVAWYFMIPFILYGVYLGYKKNRFTASAIIIFCIIMVSILATAEGNLGALFRHRDMVTPLLIIFFSAGFLKFRDIVRAG
jgi:hypothetical protein